MSASHTGSFEFVDPQDEISIKEEVEEDKAFKTESNDIQINPQNILEDSKESIKEQVVKTPETINHQTNVDAIVDDKHHANSIKKEKSKEVGIIDAKSSFKVEKAQEQEEQEEQENKWTWEQCPRCQCRFNKYGFNSLNKNTFRQENVNLVRCACCTREYQGNKYFSNAQRGKLPYERRCKICSQAPSKILRQIQKEAGINDIKQHILNQKCEKNKKRQRHEEKEEGEVEVEEKNIPNTRSSGIEDIEDMDMKMKRKSMEEKIYKLTLARRSIQRRRESNDLRGSTRIEYLVQLQEEENQLNQKEQVYRRQDPILYDQIMKDIKIRPPRSIPKHETHSFRNKKKQKKKKKERRIDTVPVNTVEVLYTQHCG
jgi:hypothetical protein